MQDTRPCYNARSYNNTRSDYDTRSHYDTRSDGTIYIGANDEIAGGIANHSYRRVGDGR